MAEIPPEELAARPDLWVENALAYQVFWELDPERSVGFDEGFIPRHVVRDYALDEALDFADLFWRIRALDRAYLADRKERREREKEHESQRAKQAQRVQKARRR